MTDAAGVAGADSVMTTGVAMADVNGDGWLDVYVCHTGKPEWAPARRRNRLYVNDGDGTFTERAEEYGLAYGVLLEPGHVLRRRPRRRPRPLPRQPPPRLQARQQHPPAEPPA